MSRLVAVDVGADEKYVLAVVARAGSRSGPLGWGWRGTDVARAVRSW